MDKPKALAVKIAEAAHDCANIPKNGWNDFHKYNYHTASDVANAVNKALSSRNVAVIPTFDILSQEVAGDNSRLITVRATVTLACGETGETFAPSAIGSGQDKGDKAVMKAQTAALKQLWRSLFIIADGDDPEADESVDKAAEARPAAATPARQATASSSTVQTSGRAKPQGEPVVPGQHNRSMVFKFGNNKEIPIKELSARDLDWYRKAMARDLADPEKARFHRSCKDSIDNIDAELLFRDQQDGRLVTGEAQASLDVDSDNIPF